MACRVQQVGGAHEGSGKYDLFLSRSVCIKQTKSRPLESFDNSEPHDEEDLRAGDIGRKRCTFVVA